ncbi:DUF6293 family protein [Halodesulfurarchaeum sp. HSR-GB]|uniref:HFX_2341 family transcriptional regulator n=1 Tax=Halodesulfurarchaeum sp. HSR-GB TaxID=3074077 RepID=UPI002859A7C8|nr:DUF6293 family protein [Halodesulfurarchaeum sp. HSR-GB]MDR5655783.1 DUF6293 family protein [Halodesulfurarchaeum sp. HSR-GB]
MSEPESVPQTHIVPVGFEYDRLIAPLIRDQFTVDRALLLQGAVGSEGNIEYSKQLARKLEADFQNLLGARTERMTVENVYDYDAAFEQAFACITAELAAGREIWVNVSSMPRPVSFAFATAAHSVMVERETDRDRIHTYYTAPEKYLETELAEQLRAGIELLETLAADMAEDGTVTVDPERIRERLAAATSLLAEFDERGATVGTAEIDGSHVQELPVAPFSNVKPFEELILHTLGEHGEFESISEFAETLAADLGEEYTDSFRSKVIYNVDRLGPGGVGYIERETEGKSYRIRLSRIGELWVRSHATEGATA